MHLSTTTRSARRRTTSLLPVLLASAMLASVLSVLPILGGPTDRAAAALGDDVNADLLQELPETGHWGVTGFDPNTEINFAQPVWDFAEIGDRYYVAGAFLNVQASRNGAQFSQPYLAAFDLYTGAWIPEFAPQLDGAVFALEISPAGELIVGGQFTNVNGAPNTSGLAAIDPETGANSTTFQANVQRPWSSNDPIVRELEVVGADLYVAGNFSHIRGNSDNQRIRTGRLGRVDATVGTPDGSWKPLVGGGAVWGFGIDTSLNRIHIGGISMSSVNGTPVDRLATIDLTTAQLVGGQATFEWNNSSARDIWDVEAAGGKVFTAGTEHMVQVLDGTDRSRLAYHTTGLISGSFNYPGFFAGGDFQVVEQVGNWVFAGCHCTYEYGGFPNRFRPQPTWYDSVADEFKRIRLVGAINASTGETSDWSPDLAGSEDGVWAVAGGSFGCVYIGGQFDVAGVEAGSAYWVGNYGRFCPPDAIPAPDTESPSTPQNGLVAHSGQTTTFTFAAATDNVGVAYYEISRNSEVVGTVDAPTTEWVDQNLPPGSYGYQARAYDAAGNRSSNSTWASVTIEADIAPPSLPANLAASVTGNTVQLTWDASVDPSGVLGYAVYRNGAYLGWTGTPGYTDAGLADGTYTYDLRAYDTVGNRTVKTPPVEAVIGTPDNEPPTLPANLAATVTGNTVQLTWDASVDPSGVNGYAVYRNGSYLGWANTPGYTDAGLADGTYAYDLRAYDLLGNRTDKTPSVDAVIGTPDNEPPTLPTTVVASADAGTVTLTWDASSDPSGVQGYAVYRNGTYVGWATIETYIDAGLPDGTYSYTLRAYDTLNNRTAPTAPVEVVLGTPDTDPPTLPANLAGTADAGTVTLTWDASSDPSGVDGYAVYRNGSYIGWTTTAGYVDAGLADGTYSYDLRAYDVLGNRTDKTPAVTVVVG